MKDKLISIDNLTPGIFNTLRILKAKNPGDTYYEEYLKHYQREGENFFDQYHFAILWAHLNKPKRILEIGVRTGLSICNMLSAYVDFSPIEKITLIDLWNDGFISENLVKMNMRALNIPEEVMAKTDFIKGNSLEEVKKLKDKYDYILVDGDHSKEGAAQDLENVVPLVNTDGVIVFDDISQYGCALDDVWQAFKEKHKEAFHFQENYKGKGVGWAIKK